MSEQNLIRSFTQILISVDFCIENKLTIPALVLIYSSIDSASWLATDNAGAKVGERFQRWVTDYMLNKGLLNCTAEELYAARCGLLHTMTPDSTLSRKRGVRTIGYAWGTAMVEKLEASMKALSSNKYAADQLEDLNRAFRLGLAEFLEQAEQEPELKARVQSRSGNHFSNLEPEMLEMFLSKVEKKT